MAQAGCAHGSGAPDLGLSRRQQPDELQSLIESIVASQVPSQHGFLGRSHYETLDDPDTLVEIADWESAEARLAHMQEASASGVYAPLAEFLAAPFRAMVIRQLP